MKMKKPERFRLGLWYMWPVLYFSGFADCLEFPAATWRVTLTAQGFTFIRLATYLTAQIACVAAEAGKEIAMHINI